MNVLKLQNYKKSHNPATLPVKNSASTLCLDILGSNDMVTP